MARPVRGSSTPFFRASIFIYYSIVKCTYSTVLSERLRAQPIFVAHTFYLFNYRHYYFSRRTRIPGKRQQACITTKWYGSCLLLTHVSHIWLSFPISPLLRAFFLVTTQHSFPCTCITGERPVKASGERVN